MGAVASEEIAISLVLWAKLAEAYFRLYAEKGEAEASPGQYVEPEARAAAV